MSENTCVITSVFGSRGYRFCTRILVGIGGVGCVIYGGDNVRREEVLKWFKHDADASTDAKISKLLIRYGAIGYAVYFHCLELIAGNVSNENITFELEHDSEIIADNLRIRGTSDKSGMEIVEEIMCYIITLGLFENHDGRITCFKMIKRLDSSMTSNPKFRKLILEAKEHHDLLDESHDYNKESHDTVKSSADTIMIFDQKVMQEQNRTEQNRKEKNNTLAQNRFNQFWSAYPRKIGKGAAEKSWAKHKVDDALLKTILDAIEKQKKCQQWTKSNGQYIPHPTTWLNQKRWLDEIDSGVGGDGRQRTLNRYGTEPGGLGVKDYMGGDDDEE